MYWIETFTGKVFDLENPTPEKITIMDIAHALSMQCRFTGHCAEFYSVAQHSVLTSLRVPKDLRLAALMHDSAEAYVGDTSRPLKGLMTFMQGTPSVCSSPHLLSDLELIEWDILEAINKKFGVEEDSTGLVQDADLRMLMTERRDLFAITTPPKDWEIDAEPYPETIRPWPSRSAKEMFLRSFYVLSKGDGNEQE